MSLLSDNVIPGKQGKVFGTNAKYDDDINTIERLLLEYDGIKDVIINKDIYPIEFTIHTDKLVSVEEIENLIKEAGFHLIPKGTF